MQTTYSRMAHNQDDNSVIYVYTEKFETSKVDGKFLSCIQDCSCEPTQPLPPIRTLVRPDF